MKITIFDTKKQDKTFLSGALKNHQLTFVEDSLSQKTVEKAKNAEAISVFVDSNVTKALLDKMPKLKSIATRSTGYDHIDVEACKARAISVCNVPTYGENTVAEYAFALLLSLARQIPKQSNQTKKGNFSREDLEGIDLQGKTIGIVGTGHIGAHAVRMAYGFNMRIIAFDVYPQKELIKKYNLTYVSYEELLKQSDIITFHVPLNKHTQHMLNTKNVKLIKPGALIINTSRGPVIQTKALLQGLKHNISGVATDVLEDESCVGKQFSPKMKNDMPLEWELITHERVLITPHNAFNTKEAKIRILATSAANLEKQTNKIV